MFRHVAVFEWMDGVAGHRARDRRRSPRDVGGWTGDRLRSAGKVELSLLSTVRMCLAAALRACEQGWGRVVVVTSRCGAA